ncbi:MAG: DUF3857 domain-containing protein [Bernardetiaceae bacterium]|nr:DUF3857 domain-containing protein [Bernardetiaceae bacterium]
MTITPLLKKNSFLFSALFFLSSSLVLAQEATIFTKDTLYNWSEHPERNERLDIENQYSAVIRKSFHRLHFFTGETVADLRLRETRHKIISLHDNQAIERFNKVTLSIPEGKLVQIKARSISQQGRVTNLGLSDIKDIYPQDGLSHHSYKIFAFDGVEIGSQIEYLYTVERDAEICDFEYIQSDLPTFDVTYELISPLDYDFVLRSYNGFAHAVHSQEQDYQIWRCYKDFIPALYRMPYRRYEAHLQRVHFKIAHPYQQDYRELLTWGEIAGGLSRSAYKILESKEVDAIQKQIEALIDEEEQDDMKKIVHIDSFLRNRVRLVPAAINQKTANNLLDIMEQGYANTYDLLKIYTAFFEQANIPHQLVATTNKQEKDFDEEFPTWDYITQVLFYFPQTGLYLAPLHGKNYSLGIIPVECLNNTGLFIKKLTLGTVIDANYYTQRIKKQREENSGVHTHYKVKINIEKRETELELKRSYKGYNALKNKQKISNTNCPEAVFATHFKLRLPNNTYNEKLNITHLNHSKPMDIGLLGEDFLCLQGKLSSVSILEEAGSRYLFRIGALLDAHPKINLLPLPKEGVERSHPEMFITEIQLEIPEGYMIRNLTDLSRQVIGKQTPLRFSVDYELDSDNTFVKIKIMEYYGNNYYRHDQLASYDEIRAAAMEFNQMLLIFDKKQ